MCVCIKSILLEASHRGNVTFCSITTYSLRRRYSRNVELRGERLRRDGLGALNGLAQGAVPHQRRQDTNATRHTEEDGVVVRLLQAVVLEQHARVRVHVRPRVLRLAVLREDARRDLVHRVDELEQLVIREVAQAEVTLARVTRVRLPQDGVAVARHNTLRVQEVPDALRQLHLELLVGRGSALRFNRALHLLQEEEHLLVGEAVERAGQTVHARAARQVRVAEGRAHKRRRVRRHVSTLVVRVDRQVQTHAVGELGGLEAHLVREVLRHAHVRVTGNNLARATVERAAVDLGGQLRHTRQQVEGVVQGVLPVVGLRGRAVSVALRELARVSEGQETRRELEHRVHVRRERVKRLRHLVDDGVARGTEVELVLQLLHLLVRGHLAREQKPPHRLRERLRAARRLRQLLLALRDGEATEADALNGVQQRRLVRQARHTTHAAVRSTDRRRSEGRLALGGLDLLDKLLLLRDLLLQNPLELRRRLGVHPALHLHRDALHCKDTKYTGNEVQIL
eukprot:Rhum_TRINITY_DN12180_c0_g1::Rhum_TRINITY_DN12180_c0_g1_i2::g.49956::m.49956